MLVIEKLEDCPNCAIAVQRWHYDAQQCSVCGYGTPAYETTEHMRRFLEAEGVTHHDMCKLSRLFNHSANLGRSDDVRINEFLKRLIAASVKKVSRDVDRISL